MTRARQLMKWLGLAAAGLLLLLAATAGLAYGYLQSDGGRAWAARTIERLVSTPGEVEVRIGRLSGRIPFAVSVGDLRVSDAAGEWLVIEALGYQVDPAALLQSSLRFRLLEAERVQLDRLPEPAAPDPSASEPAGWPVGRVTPRSCPSPSRAFPQVSFTYSSSPIVAGRCGTAIA